MLQVNLSRTLVNGLCGIVTSLDTDSVTVHFPSIRKTESIKVYSFTIFDREKGRDIACRMQIPLTLAFAHTVHKAQGLTMDKVIIDCRHMKNPGQIGVAVGRATSTAGLQILNFNTNLVKKHRKEITEYYDSEFVPLHDDLSCCRKLNASLSAETSATTCTTQTHDSDHESSDDFNELDSVMGLEGDICSIESVDQDTGIEDETVDHPCPPDIDIGQIIAILKYDDPITQQQINLNSNLEYLASNMVQTRQFCDILWNKFYKIYLECVPQAGKPENKHITALYKLTTQFVQGEEYKSAVQRLFSTQACTPSHYRTAFGIVEGIRKGMVSKESEQYFIQAKEKAISKQGDSSQSKGSTAKIRYIGGWCLATIRYRKKLYVKTNLFKKNKSADIERVDREVRCIDMLTEDEDVLLKTSENPESLEEVKRKQNLRGGLTNIKDVTLDLFVLLDSKVRKSETRENLSVHHKDFYSFIYDKVINDEELIDKWRGLFYDEDELDVNDCNESINSLLHEVVSKYLKMSSAQFRREFKRELQIQKEESHRKNIRMRKEKQKKRAIDYNEIMQDSSNKKQKTHLRLKSELADGSSEFLTFFTRDQLVKICKAYDIKVTTKMNKTQLCSMISEKVPELSDIARPEFL